MGKSEYGLFTLAIVGMVAILVFSHELMHWYQYKDLPGKQICFFGKRPTAYLDNYLGIPMPGGWKIELVPTLMTGIISCILTFYLGNLWKNHRK
jgi:hypothetical protein